MKSPKRTLPSILNDVSPLPAPTAPASPAAAARPMKGAQHSFFMDTDLETPWRRIAHQHYLRTGKPLAKSEIFNAAIREYTAQHPDAQLPMPGE